MPRIVYWRGAKTDTRTRAMLAEAAKKVKPYVRPIQGGYSNSVSASAGTHGRAAVDISCAGLSNRQANQIVKAMRQVGFAAWRRDTSEGPWVRHIHAVPIGGNLSYAAQRQVVAHKRGRNGLANNRRDRHWGMGVSRSRTWESYLRLKNRPKKKRRSRRSRKTKYQSYRNVRPGARWLRRGSAGSDVKYVQSYIGTSKCGPADGKYGPMTESGVRWYQRMRGLVVDGVVGPQTWRSLL